MFDGIQNQISEALEKLSQEEIDKLRREFLGLPGDYLQFLYLVGYGNLGEIQLYDGLVFSSSVYPKSTNLKNIVLFSDDFQGYCYGFDINDNYRVVEIDPWSKVDKTIDPSFSNFIYRYFPDAR